MCQDCFENEFKSFPSEKEWLDFDIKLTKKLASNKIKLVEFQPDGKREYIYQCLICKQKWKLKDPDYSFRGYFLKNKLKTTTSRQPVLRMLHIARTWINDVVRRLGL